MVSNLRPIEQGLSWVIYPLGHSHHMQHIFKTFLQIYKISWMPSVSVWVTGSLKHATVVVFIISTTTLGDATRYIPLPKTGCTFLERVLSIIHYHQRCRKFIKIIKRVRNLSVLFFHKFERSRFWCLKYKVKIWKIDILTYNIYNIKKPYSYIYVGPKFRKSTSDILLRKRASLKFENSYKGYIRKGIT